MYLTDLLRVIGHVLITCQSDSVFNVSIDQDFLYIIDQVSPYLIDHMFLYLIDKFFFVLHPHRGFCILLTKCWVYLFPSRISV